MCTDTLGRVLREALGSYNRVQIGDVPRSRIRRLHVEVSILPKLISGFNTIPIKIPAGFLVETGKLLLKCIWNHKGPRISKRVLKKSEVYIKGWCSLEAPLGRRDIGKDPQACGAVVRSVYM